MWTIRILSICLAVFMAVGASAGASAVEKKGGGENPCHEKLDECLRGCGADEGCQRYCLQRLGCLPGPGANPGGSATSTMKKNGGSTGPTKPPVPPHPVAKAPAAQ
jgi:hypothetical protein